MIPYTKPEIFGGMSIIMPGKSKSIQMVCQLELVNITAFFRAKYLKIYSKGGLI
ncbi:MAG: hypothetical protein ACI8WT_002168 [Clostridium sp.]|jgi:hypothetical protein